MASEIAKRNLHSDSVAALQSEHEALRVERERLRALVGKEEGLLEGILLNSPHGIIVCDVQGQLIFENEAARRIWGGRADTSSVRDWAQYRAFHADGRPYAPEDWSMARCLSAKQTTESEEISFQRFDGSFGTMLGSSAPILGSGGEVTGALSIFADISRFKELEQATEVARARASFLAGAGTALLSASLDLNATLEHVARLAVPNVADWCSIEIPEENLLTVMHADPAKVELARELRERYPTPPEAVTGVPQVLRSGVPEVYEDVSDEMLVAAARDPEHLRMLRELTMASVMVVPMIERGRSFGAITFVSSSTQRKFRADDLEMAQQLAQKAALAVTNAQLFRAEQQARAAIERAADRMSRLQTITADLASAMTSEAVASAVIDHSAAAIGAQTAGVWAMNDAGTHACMLRSWNYPEAAIQRFSSIPVDGTAPLADAIRRREPVFLSSREDYERRNAASAKVLAEAKLESRSLNSIACLPLLVGGEVVGALAFVFPLGRELDADDRVFLSVVSGHCAQSLYRARLYEAEQRARFEMGLLYELVDSVSRADTLEAVFEPALLAIERAAGVARASVLLFDSDDVMRFKAWHGLSDEYRRAVEGHTPWSRDTRHALPIIVSDVEEDPSLEPYLPVLRAEKVRSLVFIPLLHRQTLLGKFMLYAAEPRAFSSQQMALARSMATQVAHAVARKQTDAEIARLFAEAELARSDAETASRMKDEFLAVVSHELRTPMSSILGWSAILTPDRRSDPATVAKGLDVIERNARAQMRIIEDILDVSRVITGKLVIEPKPVSLVMTVAEALDVVRVSAQAKEITLDFAVDDDPHTIVGDAERLRQIVWNLLSNAIKFTPRGGRVLVRVSRGQGSVSLDVTDSGKGIPREFLPHVFERFRQADSSTTRAQGGLGLGLAIVRHLVELHGGQVCATSEGREQGSTFTVTLPVKALVIVDAPRTDTGSFVLPQRRNPSADLSQLLQGLRVLVVDDERDARELLQEALTGYGAQVQIADSARAALAMMRERTPQVLVSDIGMPEEDGYSLIAKVRGMAVQGPRLSAIALTAYARSEERQRALDAGYDEHLSKPTDPETLARLIASVHAAAQR